MTPPRPCIVGFGELLWDVLPHIKLPGGAPANFAWHAQQLGAESVIVSGVGDNEPGDALRAWLHDMHLNAEHVQTNDSATGRVNVSVSEQGEPSYVIERPSAWDEVRWTEALATLAGRADCVCFGTLAQRSSKTRETLHRFLAAVGDHCLRVFDVNLRHPLPEIGIIEQSIPLTDVLKLNEDEWPLLAERLGLAERWTDGCASLLRDSQIRLIVLTRGARGSVLITRDETLELPGATVAIHDTIGAGDAFCASIAIGLLQRRRMREIQRAAAAIAAFVCTQPGATPHLPDELKNLLIAPVPSVRVAHTRAAIARRCVSSAFEESRIRQQTRGVALSCRQISAPHRHGRGFHRRDEGFVGRALRHGAASLSLKPDRPSSF